MLPLSAQVSVNTEPWHIDFGETESVEMKEQGQHERSLSPFCSGCRGISVKRREWRDSLVPGDHYAFTSFVFGLPLLFVCMKHTVISLISVSVTQRLKRRTHDCILSSRSWLSSIYGVICDFSICYLFDWLVSMTLFCLDILFSALKLNYR